MKKINIFAAITLSLFLITGSLIPLEAAAGHNTCQIRAGSDDVYVRVFNRDKDDNPISDGFSTGEIWKGVIKKGESQSM